jgi:hypothetical protein
MQKIEEEAAAARKRDGVQVAGAAAVLAHHPHDRPEKLKKDPAPPRTGWQRSILLKKADPLPAVRSPRVRSVRGSFL